MITNGQKTSLLIPFQLPEFIRENEDYENFRLFVQSYYEWMEQNGNVIDRSKNLLNYKDVDKTSTDFIKYFIDEFIPYFPKNALISPAEAVKLAKQLYSAKGTPASFKFLFRILFNSDFEYFYTKDTVFKPSDGQWYVSKSLKLASTDTRFLQVDNYRIFGETSKSIATIEKAIRVGSKIEVFISDIGRLFQSGEFVRVVDIDNQDVLINGQIVRSKIVGQISQINIDPRKRGLLYEPGDPVILYGGLNPEIPGADDAIAEIGTITTGTIQNIGVITGGYGYREHPNTVISITNGGGAVAIVGTVDPDPKTRANVTFVPSDTIDLKRNVLIGANNYNFANIVNANANTKLSDAFSFSSFSTFPLSTIYLLNGGGNIRQIPTVKATSSIRNDTLEFNDLKNLGMLGPIQIANGGVGYQSNDVIVFTGGSGYGAHANVKNVDANGKIVSVEYVYKSELYPAGGLGYRNDSLPTLSIVSANNQANGASLFVPGIIGDGATFDVSVDKVGSVTTINILNAGEDYVAKPNVSLVVKDIVVSNVDVTLLPQKNDIIYQGNNINTFTYRALVNNISILSKDLDPQQSKYNLRVFEYNSMPNPNQVLKIYDKNINLIMANSAFDSRYNSNGIRIYGDATAKANASFLDGLVLGAGEYLNKKGQPSSYDVIQSSRYNDYTYEITVEKEISKYRDILLNLLHPTGTQVLGRYKLISNTSQERTVEKSLHTGTTLYYYTNDASSNAMMRASYDSGNNKFELANNIVKFNNIGGGTNIADFIFANTQILLGSATGPNVSATILSVDYANNQITVNESPILTYANVVVGVGTANTNTINIIQITNAYDLMNGGVYGNTSNKLRDIMFVGDRVLAANNPPIEIQSINYETKVITLKSNLANTTNSLLTISRTFVAGGTALKAKEVKIMGPIGLQYFPLLTTETGEILTTEDGTAIILG